MRYIVLFLLLCSVADAQPVVRIVGEIERTETTTRRGYGSGCCIGRLRDNRMAVLTAAHVVRDKLSVAVQWHIGDDVPITSAAEVLGITYESSPPPATDVALLAVKMSNSRRIPLATFNTPDVTIQGFPGELSLRTLHGRVLPQYVYHDAIVVGSHSVSSGMSGGPVTSRDGKRLVGVVYGFATPTEANQTSVEVIRPWLIKTLGYLPE